VCSAFRKKKDESVWSVLKSTRKTSLLSRKSEPKFLGERNLSVRALKTNRRDSRKVVSTSFPRESIRSNDAFIPRAYKRISFSHARASHPNAAKQRRNKTRAQKHTKIAIQKSLLSPPSLRFLSPTTKERNSRGDEKMKEKETATKPTREKNQNVFHTHHQNAHFLLRKEALEQFRERDAHGVLNI